MCQSQVRSVALDLGLAEFTTTQPIMPATSMSSIFAETILDLLVKVHLTNIFRRISVADRTSAALWARENLDG